jgi:hypothetical protein
MESTLSCLIFWKKEKLFVEYCAENVYLYAPKKGLDCFCTPTVISGI